MNIMYQYLYTVHLYASVTDSFQLLSDVASTHAMQLIYMRVSS